MRKQHGGQNGSEKKLVSLEYEPEEIYYILNGKLISK